MYQSVDAKPKADSILTEERGMSYLFGGHDNILYLFKVLWSHETKKLEVKPKQILSTQFKKKVSCYLAFWYDLILFQPRLYVAKNIFLASHIFHKLCGKAMKPIKKLNAPYWIPLYSACGQFPPWGKKTVGSIKIVLTCINTATLMAHLGGLGFRRTLLDTMPISCYW